MLEITCKSCKITKPKTEFFDHHTNKTGKSGSCKDCKRAQNKKHVLKKRFNISLDEYKEMLEIQDGKCAICKNVTTIRQLAVDHCHKTGGIRGLLCTSCNTAIGGFKDSSTLLNRAILYLTKEFYKE